MEFAWDILLGFWITLGQMAPYLLFGFLFAGILSVLISPQTVERHLGSSGMGAVLKAAVFGIPLPLCSCGVIPVSASLRNHGASRSATTSFLISTPQTGVDSILVTYSLLGPVFAVFRPLASLVNGVIGGLLVALLEPKEELVRATGDRCAEECCAGDERHSRPVRAIRYGFLSLPRDIGTSLLVGLAIAGVIAALVPEDYFAALLGVGIVGMIVMMAASIPLYVCATASVPIAAAFLAKGVSPGAVLVFLMTGPATNAATVSTIWKVLGRRTTFVYLGTMALTAIGSGFLLNAILSLEGISAIEHMHEEAPGWFGNVSAIVLLGILAFALIEPRIRGMQEEPTESTERSTESADGKETTELAISGMSCNHCVQSVERALRECPGVDSAEVELASGRARVRGRSLDRRSLSRAVRQLGFGAETTSA